MTMDLATYTSRFHEEPGFFDFARFGPIGEAVEGEIAAHSALHAQARFGSYDLYAHDSRMREAAAVLTGFRPDQIVFQPNTSQGLFQAMFGLSGTVIVPTTEFPSLTFAAQRAADSLGQLVPRWVEPDHGRLTPGSIRAALDPSITAVAISLVDYRTGFLADLEGIRQVIGDRLLIVDAAQGFGAVDVPYEVADVIATTGGKWLRAGAGTGLLALSDRALDRIRPLWSGSTRAHAELPPMPPEPAERGTAAMYAVGMAAAGSQAQLAAALEECAAVGIATLAACIADRVSAVIDVADEFAVPVVSPRAEAERAGIVVIEPDPAQLTVLVAALHNHGVSVTIRGGRVRIAPHATTDEEGLEILRSALLSYATAS